MAKTFRSGEVLLADFPFTDHDRSKLRPVMVVSLPEFNCGSDLVVLPISSVVKSEDKYSVSILDSDEGFVQTGLKNSSCVKWSKPITVTHAVVRRKLGTMPEDVAKRVYKLLRSMFPSE